MALSGSEAKHDFIRNTMEALRMSTTCMSSNSGTNFDILRHQLAEFCATWHEENFIADHPKDVNCLQRCQHVGTV